MQTIPRYLGLTFEETRKRQQALARIAADQKTVTELEQKALERATLLADPVIAAVYNALFENHTTAPKISEHTDYTIPVVVRALNKLHEANLVRSPNFRVRATDHWTDL